MDARDIATYLFSLSSPPSYASAAFMDDPQLKDKGKALIKQYGCAGCHEIRGFEDEQRIGKELTVEGATPIERLDFAAPGAIALNGNGRIERVSEAPSGQADLSIQAMTADGLKVTAELLGFGENVTKSKQLPALAPLDLHVSLTAGGDGAATTASIEARGKAGGSDVSILAKATGETVSVCAASEDPAEFALLRKVADMPDVLAAAAHLQRPSLMAQYLFELAQEANAFYRDVPVLNAEPGVRNRRLAAVAATDCCSRRRVRKRRSSWHRLLSCFVSPR